MKNNNCLSYFLNNVYISKFILLFLTFVCHSHYLFSQNLENEFEIYYSDEFTGDIRAMTHMANLKLESTNSSNLESIDLQIYYGVFTDIEDPNYDYIYNLTLHIRLNGLRIEYDLPDTGLFEENDCIESLPTFYFLLDGKRFSKKACSFLISHRNSNNHYTLYTVDLDYSEFKNFFAANTVRMRVYDNIALFSNEVDEEISRINSILIE
ncbi:hypothetical protein [Rhodohalobacter sp. 8-1]|uniref:hypothetical protein n=1 Tax=Rhodohalobacter sp. 8-1 TaxID=3131972 RepID=UPI0030ECEEF0